MDIIDDGTKLHKRRLMSKYDSVKVFVALPGYPSRSYVLSRYLISRMLTVAKIPSTKSVKIALMLKKHFVDRDMLSITQAELETGLKEYMEAKGFGDIFSQRMHLVQRFFCEKRPMVITICGAPSVGKSSFAQQLAARFNISSILQTDLIYELQKRDPASPFRRPTLFEEPGRTGRDLTQEYDRECHFIQRAIDAELHKCVTEGKVVILEGLHLNPGLYLQEMARFGASSFDRRHEDGRSDAVSPIYIPIVIGCSREDHWLQSREALYRRGSRFFAPKSTREGGEAIFEKIREIHTYLMECRHPDVTYVHAGLDDASSALDDLHDHFLKCISLAMDGHAHANGHGMPENGQEGSHG